MIFSMDMPGSGTDGAYGSSIFCFFKGTSVLSFMVPLTIQRPTGREQTWGQGRTGQAEDGWEWGRCIGIDSVQGLTDVHCHV